MPIATRPFLRPTMLVIGAVLGVAALAGAGAGNAPAERLIVFVQPGASGHAEAFAAGGLPAIETLAASLGLEVELVDASAGAPASVGLTPLIVHDGPRGRSVYQGRTTTLDRIRNFVLTARAVPSSDAELERTNVPVWTAGRMRVAAPVKITDLGGDRPPDFDEAAFRVAMTRAIAEGMERFELAGRVALGRSDRSFYVDFHPYRDGDLLFVSVELYSQFHCHEPVWSGLDEPFLGAWDDRGLVFADAAAELERRIVAAMGDPGGGDGFDPIPADVPVRTWSELGLERPVAERSANSSAAAPVELPSRWTVEARAGDGAAPVVFAFPAPLDGYAGRATELRGSIVLAEPGTLAGASARFEVPASSVTMGEPDLDRHVHGPAVLDVAGHPTSVFELDDVRSDDPALRFGGQTQAVLVGRFRMRGIELPLSVRASFDPVVDAEGRPRLAMTATWSIPLLDPFGIEGPDGPADASDRLRFVVRLELEPETSAGAAPVAAPAAGG